MTDRRTDGQTDRRTDRQTDGRTENTICRAAWSQLKMTVGQVEYLQDLSERRLPIYDFDLSCIGLIYFRQVNGTFGQVIFTIHLRNGHVHSIRNFKACIIRKKPKILATKFGFVSD